MPRPRPAVGRAGPGWTQAGAEVAPVQQGERPAPTATQRRPRAAPGRPTSGRPRTGGSAGPSRSARATTASAARRGELSPTARSKYDTASTATAMPVAARALAVSCAAHGADRGEHQRRRRPTPRPKADGAARVQPGRRPGPARSSRPSRPRWRRSARTSAAASGACRPTTPAPSSSARPASSSARVCRTTVRSHQDRDQHPAERGHLEHGDRRRGWTGRRSRPYSGDQRRRRVDRLGGRAPRRRRSGRAPTVAAAELAADAASTSSQTGSRTRSRRSGQPQAASGQCRYARQRGPDCRARSAAGTAPRASAAGWSGCRRRARSAARARPPSAAVSTSQTTRASARAGRARPGRRVQAGRRRSASSAATEVRVRCRSSASVPVSTVRPARMMRHPVAQRLDLGEDVARQQHGAAARRATSSMHSRNTSSISGSRPDVGSSRTSSSTSEASAATSATFCRLPLEYVRALLGRVELEPLEQLARGAVVEPAAQPAEQVDHLAAGEVRPQRRRRRARRRAAGAGPRRRARGRRRAAAPCRRPGAAARAAPGSSWTCRRRWARGSRAPRPRDAQVEPVQRPGGPERLDQALDGDDRPEVLDAGRATGGGSCGGHAFDRTLHSELCEGTES